MCDWENQYQFSGANICLNKAASLIYIMDKGMDKFKRYTFYHKTGTFVPVLSKM
jgi:hypothetical protein